MSASKHRQSPKDAARSGSHHPRGAGEGAVSLSPPRYGISLADQGSSPALQARSAGPAAVQMKRPPPAAQPTQSAADDTTIMTDQDERDVESAMEAYWGVDVVLPQSPGDENILVLRQIHRQLKLLPKDDTIDNTAWTTLELSRQEDKGVWYSNGRMVFPFFDQVLGFTEAWRDETIIHEAGHAVEEAYGVGKVSTEFTQGKAGWVIEGEASFKMRAPVAFAALQQQPTPHHKDPLARMYTFQNGNRDMVSTKCTTGEYATFPKETRDRAMNVSNYSLSAPREFFAEMYTAFYKDTDPADFGRVDFGNVNHRIPDDWATWIRDNIHKKDGAGAGVAPVAAAPPVAAPPMASEDWSAWARPLPAASEDWSAWALPLPAGGGSHGVQPGGGARVPPSR